MRNRSRMVVVVALLLASCSKSSVSSGPTNNRKHIEDVISHFKADGISVSGKSEKLAGIIGASDGCGVDVGGSQFEIYQFDVDVPVQKNLIDKYEKEGLQGDPVIRNGSFILLPNEKDPLWAKVAASFKSF